MATNFGNKPSPYTILYHMNIGYPLLSEDSVLVIDPVKTMPRDDSAASGINEFKKFTKPQAGFREQVFDHLMKADSNVDTEELEKFYGRPYDEILDELTGSSVPDTFNVGGPSLVYIIHASQMLSIDYFDVNFFGMAGNNETAGKILSIVLSTPLKINNSLALQTVRKPFVSTISNSVKNKFIN